jgi:multidrug efflux pump subunit AcrB
MKKVKIGIIEASMKYHQVTLVVTLLLMIVGLIALFTMPRSEDPKITVRSGLVIAILPGADEVQVEKQVTNKLEQYLFSFEEVRKEKTKSETKEGQVIITCELNENVKDPKRFWATLQHGLNTTFRMQNTLPTGLVGPIVNSDFGDVVTQMITVSAPGRSYAEIEKYLDRLEDGLKTIPETSKIKRYGGQKQQIYITIQDEKLRQYEFDFSTIARVLQMQNVTNYSGGITLENSEVSVLAKSQYKNEAEIGNQIIYSSPDGKVVRLKDVATIDRRYEEPSSFIKLGDQKVMMLTVEMQPGKNIVQFGDKLKERIAEVKATLPQDVKVNTIVDQPEVVRESISHFMLEFGIAILSVIIVVIILLPFRVAMVSAVACPISIVITFGILNILGIEIHQVTLAALIIVLGMVVDNAIVVVDNYIEKLDEGIDPWTAGWQSATQLMLPVFTATAAIIFAFLPLAFFLNGLAKEFIQSLPIAVAVSLITSFVVAILLTPYMCYIFIKKGLKHKVSNEPLKKNILDRLQEKFNKGLEYSFKWPKITLMVGISSVVVALLIASSLEQELFPTAERNQFNLEVWLPNGTSLEQTDKAVERIEKEIKSDKRVLTTASFIGTSSPRFHSTYAPEMPRRNFAQIFITTTGKEATQELAEEYLKKFDGFLPDGYVRIRQLAMKLSPAPLEVRITGENINDQKQVAKQVAAVMQNAEGTNWTRTTYQDDYYGVKIELKEDVANRLGVTNSIVTQTLGATLKGYPVATLYEGDKPIDILVRLDPKNRSDFNALENIYISTIYGTKVPLKEVSDVKPAWHTGIIAHLNGLRTLTVQSEAQKGIKATTILTKIQPEIDKIKLPEGIKISYGGEFENTNETVPGMMMSLGVSLVLIFMTLLFQFRNFTKVLIILSTFPLSLLGAFLGLKLTGNPIGFTAFMGIISLIGIVVRNGIILVDYADELIREHGYTVKAAAMASGKRRMRPIFLTSIAAAVGVIPMIAGKSPLWAPLGSVLAVGLIVSMIMTLFVVPVLYFKFIKTDDIYNTPHPHPSNVEDEAFEEILYKPSHTKNN